VALLLSVIPRDVDAGADATGFDRAIRGAEAALERKDYASARLQVRRALERDPCSPLAWRLRAELAGAEERLDDQLYSLCRCLELRTAQKAPAQAVRRLAARISDLHPAADRALELVDGFVEDLERIARRYEKLRKPHSAIRIWQRVVALNGEHETARASIEELSRAPDPALARTARRRDLLADVSRSWIEEFDADHRDWEHRARQETPQYDVETDAGYEVLVRTVHALEGIHRHFRQHYGFTGRKASRRVPGIKVQLFRTKKEYLDQGGSGTKEWSDGQYTGDAVMVCVENDSFTRVLSTLFHEIAHQFVSLTNRADTWLNEAQATFFESSRILPNGCVVTNLPNSWRLSQLATRMGRGWMEDEADGIDPDDPNAIPPEAPRIRTVIESGYEWGPAWYSPVWGLIYFLHNYQDPEDGRFVYRRALWDFVEEGSPHSGPKGVEEFEARVLNRPSAPTPDHEGAGESMEDLPATLEELDALWRIWIRELKASRRSPKAYVRPWGDWAAHAIARREWTVATEFFEKGLDAEPDDAALRAAFAEHLAEHVKDEDRGACELQDAIGLLREEGGAEAEVEAHLRHLRKIDPLCRRRIAVEKRLNRAAREIVERCEEDDLPLSTMYFARRLGARIGLPGLQAVYERTARAHGKGLGQWKLLYNESDLTGWTGGGGAFEARESRLVADWATPAMQGNRARIRSMFSREVPAESYSFEVELRMPDCPSPFAGILVAASPGGNAVAVAYHPRGVTLQCRDETGLHLWGQAAVPSVRSDWHRVRVDVLSTVLRVHVNGKILFRREFGNAERLRGTLGILDASGKVEFRNLRYRAWEPWERPGTEEPVGTSGEEAAPDGIVLFDGKSRDGWVDQPAGTWSIVDEKLVAVSFEGAGPSMIVCTKHAFQEYRLTAEVQRGTRHAFFAARVPERQLGMQSAVVVRMQEDWFKERDWNEFEAVVSKSEVVVSVNGKEVFRRPCTDRTSFLGFSIGPRGALGIRNVVARTD